MQSSVNDAKNLLLNKTCENCKNAGSLVDLQQFYEMADYIWFNITEEKKEDVCLESVIYDTIFYCHINNKTLPKEFTCNYWEEIKE